MRKLLLLLPFLMAPAAQAWPLWAEQQAIKFCEYRAIGIDTITAIQAVRRDLNEYPQLVDAVPAAEADGTYVKVTAAAIKEECPGEWQRGLKN